MKKNIALLLCLCLMLSLFTGCTKPSDEAQVTEPSVPIVEQTEATEEMVEKVAEWKLNKEDSGVNLPDELMDALESVNEDLLKRKAQEYAPITCIAKRESDKGVVYRIMCKVLDAKAASIAASIEKNNDSNNAENNENKEDTESEEQKSDALSFAEIFDKMKKNKRIIELCMIDILINEDGKVEIVKLDSLDFNKVMEKTKIEMNDEAIVNVAEGWTQIPQQITPAISEDIQELISVATENNAASVEPLFYLGCLKSEDCIKYAILCDQITGAEVSVKQAAIMFISVSGETVELFNIVTM